MNPALRWILVLPAAVAAYFAVQIANVLATGLLPSFLDWSVQLFNSWAGPIALVLVGAKVAPSNKFVVALCLTVIHAIILAVIVTMACLSRNVSTPIWWLIVCAVVGIGGSILVCVWMREDKSLLA